MTASVTAEGLLIPKTLLQGAQNVEIVEQPGRIVIVLDPAKDPIRCLGKNPVRAPESDASTNHDKYLYGNQ